MSPRLGDVSLRHIDSESREARPSLLETVEKTSGAAADVEQLEEALIAPGEKLVQRRQRLSSGRIGRPIEQHLDLGIVSLRRILRHPAARLEVKIPKIVVRPLATRVLGQHLPVVAVLAAAVDFRQVLEE